MHTPWTLPLMIPILGLICLMTPPLLLLKADDVAAQMTQMNSVDLAYCVVTSVTY